MPRHDPGRPVLQENHVGASATVRRKRLRIAGWDWLRVAAAFDTASHHIGDRHLLFGFGLPLFLILSVALSVSRARPNDSWVYLASRFKRVVLPWIFWSLALAVERVVLDGLSGRTLLAWWEPAMLLYGPRIHLWFLPAIFVAGLLAHGVHRLLDARFHGLVSARRGGQVSLWMGAGLAAVLLTVPTGRAVGWPFEQWLFTLAALPMGWMFGRALAQSKRRGAFSVSVLGLSISAALMLAWFLSPASAGVIQRYGAACVALLLAVFMPAVGMRWVRIAAPLMLGVYVLHPTVDRWLTAPALSSFSAEGFGFATNSWVTTGAAFVVTMAIVALLRRTPMRMVL